MIRLFVYIIVMLLFSAGAVFAGEGAGYGTQPYGPQSGSDSQAQSGKSDPGSQKSGGHASGSEGARSSYRQEGPNNPIKSRWQIDMGGFVGMGVERRQ